MVHMATREKITRALTHGRVTGEGNRIKHTHFCFVCVCVLDPPAALRNDSGDPFRPEKVSESKKKKKWSI
jgi:hypothetical protein